MMTLSEQKCASITFCTYFINSWGPKSLVTRTSMLLFPDVKVSEMRDYLIKLLYSRADQCSSITVISPLAFFFDS